MITRLSRTLAALLAASTGATVLGLAAPALADTPLAVTGIVQQVIAEPAGHGDEGVFGEVGHGDVRHTLVVTPSGTQTVEGLADVPTGTRVRTTLSPGFSATGARAVRSFSVVAAAPAVAAAADYTAKPVVVVPVQWSGHAVDKTGAQVAGVVDAQVDSYWKDASGGRIGFHVSKVTAPLTLPGTFCQNGTVSDTALQQIYAAAGYTPGRTVAHILAYATNDPTCQWAGLATISNNDPGYGGWAVINGTARLDVMGHELGHNLGLGHSNLRWCDSGGVRTTEAATCTVQPYRDPYDIMGIAWGTSGNLSAPQRDQLGLLSPGGITDLTAGQLTLAPLGGTAGVRGARLTDGTARYFLEYRTKTGRDSWIDGSAATSGYAVPGSGVVIHRADTLKPGGGTQLLDGNPIGAKLDRAALRAGEAWTSPSGKVTLTVVSTSATGAVVRLGTAMPGPFSLTGVPAAGKDLVVRTGAVQVTWGASADTGTGIARYEVLVNGAVAGTTAADATSATVTVPAGRSTVTVRAVDGQGVTRTASNSVRYLVDGTAPVATGPRAVFRGGSASSTFPVTTSWTATDAGSGVCGQALTSGTTRSVAAGTTSVADALPAGTTPLTVTVTDCAGNEVTATGSAVADLVQDGAFRYSGTWGVARSSAVQGGTVRSTSKAGSAASATVTSRAVALVASRSAAQGVVRVYVDGKVAATVDLRASQAATRQVVWTYAWSSTGAHTVKVVNVGTTGRPYANVDALLTLR
ncbi:MAG TPA: hypothetical protein VGD72_01990 [Mycobacteriales bacterium]